MKHVLMVTTIIPTILLTACGSLDETRAVPGAETGDSLSASVEATCEGRALEFTKSNYGSNAKLLSGRAATLREFQAWEAERLGAVAVSDPQVSPTGVNPDVENLADESLGGVVGPLVNRTDPAEVLTLCYFGGAEVAKGPPPNSEASEPLTVVGILVDAGGEAYLYSAAPLEADNSQDFPAPIE